MLVAVASLLLLIGQAMLAVHDGSHSHLPADRLSCDVCLLPGAAPDPTELQVDAPAPVRTAELTTVAPESIVCRTADLGACDARAPPNRHSDN